MVHELTLHSVKFMIYIWVDSVNTSFMKSKLLALEKMKVRLEEKGIPLANSLMQVVSEYFHPASKKRANRRAQSCGKRPVARSGNRNLISE